MQLLYGEDGCREQGEAWYAALSDADVPVEMWIYPGGHLPAPDVVDEIYLRAAAWFRRWATAGVVAQSGARTSARVKPSYPFAPTVWMVVVNSRGSALSRRCSACPRR